MKEDKIKEIVCSECSERWAKNDYICRDCVCVKNITKKLADLYKPPNQEPPEEVLLSDEEIMAILAGYYKEPPRNIKGGWIYNPIKALLKAQKALDDEKIREIFEEIEKILSKPYSAKTMTEMLQKLKSKMEV